MKALWKNRRSCILVALAVLLGGCSSGTRDPNAKAKAAQEQAQEAARKLAGQKLIAQKQLEAIPLPSKNLYVAVHTEANWQNPFIRVDRDTLKVHILLADANPSTMGQGGMLRPAAARRQEVLIRLADLPDTLASLPASAWPYGRVVAVAENTQALKVDRPQVRRNVETTLQMLNDLNVVADEWNEAGTGILR